MANDDPIVHSKELDWEAGGHGDLFAYRRKRLGTLAGGTAIGCSMIELAPGKTAWPFHHHWGNEEAMFVLEGEATLRLGEQRFVVRAGDYVAFPAGDARRAHQMTNTSGVPCRYLMVSTMKAPDVTVYPDSNKVGVFGSVPPGGSGEDGLRLFVRSDAGVGYWEGEPGVTGSTSDVGAGSPRDAASKPSTTTAQRRASGGGQAQAGGPSKDASQPGTSPRAYARKIGRRLDEAFAELRSRLEGEELPEPGVPGRAKPGVDEAELERQIDAEMEQLKRQLGLGRSSPGSASSGASTGASAQASTNDEAAVDEELEALKRKRDE